MLDKLATQSSYKIFSIIGILLVIATPYLSWQHGKGLEESAITVFEQGILAKLDLKSLQLQLQSIESAVLASQNKNDNPDAVDYSDSELEQLLAESDNLNNQIEQLILDVKTLDVAKKAIITDLKLAFIITLLVMLVALLLAVFGLLGWYFHVRIFEERRSEFGQGRITDQ